MGSDNREPRESSTIANVTGQQGEGAELRETDSDLSDDETRNRREQIRAEAKRKLAAKLVKITLDAQRGRLSITSHEELSLFLRSKNVIRSDAVFDAFALTDRGFYAGNRAAEMKTQAGREAARTSTYWDRPLSIGYGATISAPHMHATALENLKDHLFPGASALDVGSGTGYLSACMARMVGDDGRVIGIDHIPELVQSSLENVINDDKNLLRDLNVIDTYSADEGSCPASSRGEAICAGSGPGPLSLVVGDGRLGFSSAGPYHAIHVGAAAPEIPPALVEQLAPGGRMIIPVGPEATRTAVETDQYLLCVDKKEDGRVETRKLMGVIYVPLTDKDHQLAR